MNADWNKISSKQLFAMIVTAQIGSGVLSIASTLADKVGHDGWISLLISGALMSIIIIVISMLMNKYKNKDILDITKLQYGKYLGFIFNVLLLVYLSIVSALALRIFCDIIKIVTLKLTPPLALTIFIIIPTLYLTYYGLKPICRYAGAVLILYIAAMLFYILVFKYVRFTFLMPVNEIGMSTIISNTPLTFVSFLGFELVIFIYPFVRDKENALKYSLFANMFTIVFYLTTVIVLTGFFGELMLKKLVLPLLSLARAYRAPVVERLDLFFVALWFPILDSSFRKYFFCAYIGISKVFNIKTGKIYLFLFTASIIFLSRIPKNIIEVYKYLSITGNLGMIVLGFICICYIMSFIVKRGLNNEKT